MLKLFSMLIEVYLITDLLPKRSSLWFLLISKLFYIIVVKYINVLLILYRGVRATELYNPMYDFICMLFRYTLTVN